MNPKFIFPASGAVIAIFGFIAIASSLFNMLGISAVLLRATIGLGGVHATPLAIAAFVGFLLFPVIGGFIESNEIQPWLKTLL